MRPQAPINVLPLPRLGVQFMTDSEQSNRKLSIWRWQFSIRTLLILSALVAVFVGGFFNRMRAQEQAVNTIADLGGRVVYEDTWLAGMLPEALRESIGIHATSRVVSVELLYRNVDRRMTTPTKDELASFVSAVKKLPHAKCLATHTLNLTDDDLAIFAPLKDQIEELSINEYFHGDFRGARLELLDGWNQLRTITILSSVQHISEPMEGRERSDQLNLKPLSKLPHLESLTIGRGMLSDQVFEDLAQIRTLKNITLVSCRFSGKGFETLAKLQQLEYLILHNTHPEVDHGAFLIGEDGSMKHLDEPTFHFEPSHDGSMGSSSKGFPQKKYDKWIKATFGDVDVYQDSSS